MKKSVVSNIEQYSKLFFCKAIKYNSFLVQNVKVCICILNSQSHINQVSTTRISESVG